ncbi:hypothetical protein RO3G_13828 [Rhizopus delemar RA 99-880]|uniref:Translin n=1 Tax=Rhizopus delemar (strain RA 99-880 / ATCC MYA-4621 / FGSC 9543 / NRRL 43880) TaxID=246409 RepID=I1CKY7_RHIO9|nr:hypothetical protein RO3G_13828 [Rhizopus delemar RA 99-880]|eukprot:EIE89117.1 hypothetical protein RO3G_13828 [Rhizopus delemar RA 99-880]
MDLKFFADLQQSLEEEAQRKEEIRTAVKELDKACRQLNAKLSQIHANPKGPVPSIDYSVAQEHIQVLAKLIPPHEFYRYNDLWSRTTQQAVYLVVFESYLENNGIVDNIIPKIESSLGGNDNLSRLAVNCVTVGDYDRPLLISKHVKDLSSGFQLLNLKNDAIRKRFDSIKYDVKKIEEVVYDITLRGLHNPNKRVLSDDDHQEVKNKKA